MADPAIGEKLRTVMVSVNIEKRSVEKFHQEFQISVRQIPAREDQMDRGKPFPGLRRV